MFDIFKKKKHKLAVQYIDYEYRFFSDYGNDYEFKHFISKVDYRDRLIFVINTFKNDPPSPKKYFILALAYFKMPVEYTNYAIFYAEEYLKTNMWFKGLKNGITKSNEWNLQLHIFNSILSICYMKNLEFDTSIKYAFSSKAGYLTDLYYFNPYTLLANGFYHIGDYDKALSCLNDGYRTLTQPHQKLECQLEFEKYKEFKKRNKIYKPNKKPLIRRDIKTGLLYNYKTGEFIQ